MRPTVKVGVRCMNFSQWRLFTASSCSVNKILKEWKQKVKNQITCSSQNLFLYLLEWKTVQENMDFCGNLNEIYWFEIHKICYVWCKRNCLLSPEYLFNMKSSSSFVREERLSTFMMQKMPGWLLSPFFVSSRFLAKGSTTVKHNFWPAVVSSMMLRHIKSQKELVLFVRWILTLHTTSNFVLFERFLVLFHSFESFSQFSQSIQNKLYLIQIGISSQIFVFQRLFVTCSNWVTNTGSKCFGVFKVRSTILHGDIAMVSPTNGWQIQWIPL